MENKKNSHKKIAAVVVTVLVCGFYLITFIVPSFKVMGLQPFNGLSSGEMGSLFMISIGIIVIFCMISVLRTRLREINSGQEDDIDKY